MSESFTALSSDEIDCAAFVDSWGGCLVELIVGRGAGRGVDAESSGVCLGGNLGAVRTFHSGFALGACLPRDAEMLKKSWSKKMSKEMFGIWTKFGWLR